MHVIVLKFEILNYGTKQGLSFFLSQEDKLHICCGTVVAVVQLACQVKINSKLESGTAE